MSLALALSHLFLRLSRERKQWSRIENEIVGASPMTTTEYFLLFNSLSYTISLSLSRVSFVVLASIALFDVQMVLISSPLSNFSENFLWAACINHNHGTKAKNFYQKWKLNIHFVLFNHFAFPSLTFYLRRLLQWGLLTSFMSNDDLSWTHAMHLLLAPVFLRALAVVANRMENIMRNRRTTFNVEAIEISGTSSLRRKGINHYFLCLFERGSSLRVFSFSQQAQTSSLAERYRNYRRSRRIENYFLNENAVQRKQHIVFTVHPLIKLNQKSEEREKSEVGR